MSLALIVYLAGIEPSLSLALRWVVIILLFAYLIWWAAKGIAVVEDCEDKVPQPGAWIPVVVSVCVLLNVIIPNKETIYTMVAAHTVQDIATSPKVQEFGGKSLEVIEKVMDDYLKEVKPAKAEGEK